MIDPLFQDTVINAIVAASKQEDEDGKTYLPFVSNVSLIYRNTSRTSPARRLMVDFYVSACSYTWIESSAKSVDYFDLESLMDLVVGLVKDRTLTMKKPAQNPNIDSGTLCSYHKHDKNKPCMGKLL